ncbi:MAG: hypothetical protein AAB295_03765, partial [Chloroflexota bacterium]
GIPALERPCHHCKPTRHARRRRQSKHFHCAWCRDSGVLRGVLACRKCKGAGRIVISGPSRKAMNAMQEQLVQPMLAERQAWSKGGEGIFSRNAWDPV